MSKSHSLLFSEIKIGSLTLPNRIIMGSMHTGLDHTDDPYNRLAAFYEERAKGGVGLIVTGGVAPNEQGLISPGATILNKPEQVDSYRIITEPVHAAGSKIIMQILHAGRYAKQADLVAPSAIRSPINKFEPREISHDEILQTIEDFANCAELSQKAGFDGVELLGSEGYFLNEFTAERTNQRNDKWGGSFENRTRLPLEIVRAIRRKLGSDFFIQYRMSVLELVEGGWNIEEAQRFATELESAGVDLINTGIGWHEASIPTIAMDVPRAAFSWATGKIKEAVNIPVAAANRINTVEVAEEILQRGDADMLYMARPFLADSDFVNKAKEGHSNEINSCIACNQSCLDNLFNNKTVSCLVNPRACHETVYPPLPATDKPQKIAVIGAGAAGLAFSIEASKQGHNITLFESGSTIGGQLLHAHKVPGKEEFDELLRYFQVMLDKYTVNLQLNCRVDAGQLEAGNFDAIILASGIKPRELDIPGIKNSKVLSYEQVFSAPEKVGQRVIIIGAGGIGFDMAGFLTHSKSNDTPVQTFNKNWGIDPTGLGEGGLASNPAKTEKPSRDVTLLQRKAGRFGKTLGKTTGWIHQIELQKRGVQMIGDLNYLKIDDAGLHIEQDGKKQLLPADNIIICAGQESQDELTESLSNITQQVYRIGGVKEARELDAAQAIRDGIQLAYSLGLKQ
ncbi:MAG: NADPH-dependent 2,4-dienoyl-CoA reductase [Gammaproteobacteria bacterium]|nr:MAG: NADPH-dependent 2,4-dienoyl-CoA reductase [Gammaproteobacteria bacterium]